MRGNFSKILSVLLIGFIIITTLLGAITTTTVEGLSTSGVDLFVDGKEDVFVNQTVEYKVRIGGVFGNDAKNWSLKSSVEGSATISPKEIDSNRTNVFTVNLTVKKASEVTLNFKGYSSDGEEVRYSEDSIDVKAVKPAQVSVLVENPKDIALENVKIGLFIDEQLVQSKQIKLSANQSKEIQLNWSKEGFTDGEHILKVGVDYGYQEPGEYTIILEKTIYLGEKSFALYNWSIAIALIGLMVLFFFYLRKKKKRRRPW